MLVSVVFVHFCLRTHLFLSKTVLHSSIIGSTFSGFQAGQRSTCLMAYEKVALFQLAQES